MNDQSTTTEQLRGVCSHCRRVMRITKAGVLGHHVDQAASSNGLPWRPRCPGAGKKPAEEGDNNGN